MSSHWQWWHKAGMWAILALFLVLAVWTPFAAIPSWLMVMAGMLAFTLLAGHGISGVWSGAFIDDRNKVSLSRFQMLAWTVLILSALGTLVIMRAQRDPGTALNVTIDQSLLILMGISTVSLVGSPLIKSNKQSKKLELNAARTETLKKQGLGAENIRGAIVDNRTIHQASWADMFMGEEVDNVANLDLAKIQMFFFTVLLLLTYGIAIAKLLTGVASSGPLPGALPDVSENMVMLLGISHSGYLAAKAVPASSN